MKSAQTLRRPGTSRTAAAADPTKVTSMSRTPDTSPRTLTKIVATIGPASESPEMVRRLILAGVSVFRFNFSHGAWDEHLHRLRTVREEAERLGRAVACLGDLPGPKIRVGRVPGEGIDLAQGMDVCFRTDVTEGRIETRDGHAVVVLPTTYPDLLRDVKAGQRVLINDGAIRMLAIECSAAELRCRVTVAGLVTTGKGINLPESDVSAPAITDRDREAVRWAVEQGMDYLALSFVRTAQEIRELQDWIWSMRPSDPSVAEGRGVVLPIIAKIEKPQAMANIESIVEAADGIMVARGDLGVEMEIAAVPVAQKRILDACHRHGKPCIVATQMLETMITNASPTRAEASDVANAIFDGTDAVMLSGETAVGKYPELTVQTMKRIIAVAEQSIAELHPASRPPTRTPVNHRPTAALAGGARQAADDLGAKAIACWSQSAGTARYLSQQDFHVPILACTSNPRALRRMALYRGVTPLLMQPPASGRLSEWNQTVDAILLELQFAAHDDWIVMLAGRPLGQAKRTNTLAIHKVGESETGFQGQ